MTHERIDDRAVRQDQILAAALTVAVRVGYPNVTRAEVAREVGCSPALITVHFGTMTNFKRDIVRYAVRVGNLKVIAQGMAMRNPHALRASEELRKAARQALP